MTLLLGYSFVIMNYQFIKNFISVSNFTFPVSFSSWYRQSVRRPHSQPRKNVSIKKNLLFFCWLPHITSIYITNDLLMVDIFQPTIRGQERYIEKKSFFIFTHLIIYQFGNIFLEILKFILYISFLWVKIEPIELAAASQLGLIRVFRFPIKVRRL